MIPVWVRANAGKPCHEPAAAGDLADAADGWQLGASGRAMTVLINVAAAGGKGGRVSRQAGVRLLAEPSLSQAPYQVLTWSNSPE